MPKIAVGSTVQQMHNICNEVRETFSFEWDDCVTYSFDNTNFMIEKRSSLFQKIRSAQGDQKIFGVGCPCHLVHLCAGKGAKERTFNKC